MSVQDFEKLISQVQGEDDIDGRLNVCEAYIRYVAKGGVNTFHAWKIAKLIRDRLGIEKKPK